MYTDAKKESKMPRLPPNRHESVQMLFTTYVYFLLMLFGPQNQHLTGLNQVQNTLMDLQAYARCLSQSSTSK